MPGLKSWIHTVLSHQEKVSVLIDVIPRENKRICKEFLRKHLLEEHGPFKRGDIWLGKEEVQPLPDFVHAV